MKRERQLQTLTEEEFRNRLRAASPVALVETVQVTLFAHYNELRRWNSSLSLVGPGTAHQVVERHYGESLAALPWIRPTDRKLVDLGTGGGFPGLVLAAACPWLEVILTEPRERKWSFLMTAVRRCGLSCQCLGARVDNPLPDELPEDIDLVTSRALRVSSRLLEALFEHSPGLRVLLWHGARLPELPRRFKIGRRVPLAGGEQRWLSEIHSTNRDNSKSSD